MGQGADHASLKRNLIEECYEALEAIDIDDPAGLSEELGDILVQVVFHSQMAAESSRFSIDDVVAGVADKLVRRHPHVFGDGSAKDAREVELNWDQLKKRGKRAEVDARRNPKDLPALARAQLTQDRVGREGFEWEDISGCSTRLSKRRPRSGTRSTTKNGLGRSATCYLLS